MFGKKKASRKAAPRLILSGRDGAQLSACPAGDYALPEKAVLSLSVEYFNDPEPCAIHRGAVHKRAMLELMEHCPVGSTISIASLPVHMREWFPADAAHVQITENIQ